MPTLEYEHRLQTQGYQAIAGIDEAGRGCWAGPVVAAAVILRPAALADETLLAGIDDSKRLSPEQRARMLPRIEHAAAGIGIGSVPAFLIDLFGIVRATRLAMELAVLQMGSLPDALVIDALRLPTLALPQTILIWGDSLCYSVAAASIIAKTTRDRRMRELGGDDDPYGFVMHKGYGTPFHRAALGRWGASSHHRHSFRPLWNKEFP